MNILGIESTAHTFGIGIVNDKGEILRMYLQQSQEALFQIKLQSTILKYAIIS